MTLQPFGGTSGSIEDAWKFSKRDSGSVIAVIGTEQDAFIQQAVLDEIPRPCRQQDLMKICFFDARNP